MILIYILILLYICFCIYILFVFLTALTIIGLNGYYQGVINMMNKKIKFITQTKLLSFHIIS